MQPYDKSDKMSRLKFCEVYGVNLDTEKRARSLGLPWPPWVILGRSVFYSRVRCSEWFAAEEAKSQGAVADV